MCWASAPRRGWPNGLDSDEVSQAHLIDSMGRSQEMTIISESGLYNVILRSDKPEAKPFRKWVTAVVPPSIRKNGGYIAGQEGFPRRSLWQRPCWWRRRP